MKRVCQIAAVLIVAGLVCGVIGAAFGGGAWGWNLFGKKFDNEARYEFLETEQTERTLSDTDSIRSLKIDVDALEVLIQSGDKWAVSSNVKQDYLSCETENGALVIEMTNKWTPRDITRNWDAQLKLTIPEGLQLDDFEVDADAAVVGIYDLNAKTVGIDCDATAVTVDRLEAEQLDIDCDAGSIEGAVRLTRGGKWDCDAGSIEMGLLDGSTVGEICGESNLGSIEIDGKDLDEKIIRLEPGDGGTLDLSCNLGSIEIRRRNDK